VLEGVQIQSVVSSTAAAASAATLMKSVSAATPGVTVSNITIPTGGNTVNLNIAAHQKLLAGEW